MSDFKQVGDLEINQDLEFQQKEWAIENVGWIAMVIIVAAALLGLFGHGLLSNATDKNDAFQVDYGRFERVLAPAEFRVMIDPQQVINGEIRLQISRDLLSPYKLELITPQPYVTELSPEKVTYVFKVGEGNQPLKISLVFIGNQVGLTSGEISVGSSPALKISQFIYP